MKWNGIKKAAVLHFENTQADCQKTVFWQRYRKKYNTEEEEEEEEGEKDLTNNHKLQLLMVDVRVKYEKIICITTCDWETFANWAKVAPDINVMEP